VALECLARNIAAIGVAHVHLAPPLYSSVQRDDEIGRAEHDREIEQRRGRDEDDSISLLVPFLLNVKGSHHFAPAKVV
jgi:hypothetical protein